MKTSAVRIAALVVLVGTLASSQEATAAIDNFDLSGQIYTKWLYRNNDQMGMVTWGNPFWPENFTGDNGVGSEFEWNITGRPSRYVTAEVRLKSRFGSTWHDFWENGDISYPEENTSGESLGMNHAEYIKLRGYSIDIHPPWEWLDTIRVGSSDLNFWNPWTIGRVRYIDRDNAKGIFFHGMLADGDLGWTLAAIAMPKLWAGPGWSTGIGDVNLTNPFYTLDYMYGLHVDYWLDALGLEMILDVAFSTDFEVNLADPDAEGSYYPTCEDELGNPIPGCVQDQQVDLGMRYLQTLVTLQLKFELFQDFYMDILGGFSMQNISDTYASNGVALNAGVSPMPYKDTRDWALRARIDYLIPVGDNGLNLRLEYFNIQTDWVATFGARREADVLLTDGFISGGQLPTLNIANEFQDFDEPFFESCIGWHGVTLILNHFVGDWEWELEGTYLTYNTNMQDRNVDDVYPDFLHTDGYTDTWFWDFANTLDRGRDTRSVYTENQDRQSVITGLRSVWDTGWLTGIVMEVYLKFIWDQDNRDLDIAGDDYTGKLFFSNLELNMPIIEQIAMNIGGDVTYWDEAHRSGSVAGGYPNYETFRARGYGGFTFTFGGVIFEYRAEYLHKHQERVFDTGEQEPTRNWNIFRSKAYMIVAW